MSGAGATQSLVALLDSMQSAGSPHFKALLAATVRTPNSFDAFLRAIAASALQIEDISDRASDLSTRFQHLIVPQPQLPVRLLEISIHGPDR